MSTVPERQSYLDAPYGIAAWLLTRDHKRIAMLYLISITIFFMIGGLFALGIRLELITPKGDLLTPDVYNKMFTLHGVIMVFFFLIPSIPATLGNFFIPIMCGTKDLAFPRINLLSWYLYVLGGVLALGAAAGGGLDTGWTFYTPYSTMSSTTNVTLAAMAAFVAGFSSILTGFNFIVTVHRMRAPGLTWFRLPLFVWAHYATSLVMILGTPVIAITLVLVMAERTLGLPVFDPKIGGDPVLFQHLFWFYSHPAVYIMILPGMGVVSELVAGVSRKQVFGYSFVAFSSLAIAILGFLVWGHHLFVSSQSIYAGLVFSIITMLVAVPSAVKTFNWAATMYKGAVTLGVADLLGHWLHGTVPDWRPDRIVPRDARSRHSPDRHVLRGRALPLHHGRRGHHGVPRRRALLLAEDVGPHVSRGAREARGDSGLRRVQHHLLPAVHPGVPRHAAPVSRVSG